MKDSMKKRRSDKEKELTAKYEKYVTTKCEKYESDKTQKRKVRKRTNVCGWTEAKVEALDDSTEACRKDENSCIEVRNTEEEVPPFI